MNTTQAARVTIKDVARQAGVGVVTVSRVFNDQPGVSEATRDRVRAVATQLGYRPNRHARMLKMGTNRSIALMMKGIDNPFFQQMLDIMESAARERDYRLIVTKVPNWADEVSEASRFVDEDAVAGVIFLGGNFTHDASVFDALSAPFVLSTIGALEGMSPEAYSSVAVDDAVEARRAVEYLIAAGHSRIGYIGAGTGDISVGRRRHEGYLAALAQAGITPDPAWSAMFAPHADAPYQFEAGYRLAHDLLVARDEVTAIFATADVLALGAIRAALDLGLRVPGDLSVIGFDGIPVGNYYAPRLSTIVQPAEQIAELTCQLLFEQIDGGPARHVTVDAQLRAGESVAAPPESLVPRIDGVEVVECQR